MNCQLQITCSAFAFVTHPKAEIPDWFNLTPLQVAEHASRRSITAIGKVGTLNSDVEALTERIVALEAAQRDLTDVLSAVLAMIEGESAS